LDQNVTSRSTKPHFGHGGALQPRQRLGAEGFLDDIKRLRRLLRRRIARHGRLTGAGLHRHGWRGHHVADASRSALWRRRRPLGYSIAGCRDCHRLRRRSSPVACALLAHFLAVSEQRLPQFGRGQKPRHLQHRTAGPHQIGFDEAARIGCRGGEIASRAAPRSETEAVQRHQCALRIACHAIVLAIVILSVGAIGG
jgi:hypothetical protein